MSYQWLKRDPKTPPLVRVLINSLDHRFLREVRTMLRLEVKLADIWAVVEFVDGEQRDLFLDAETVKSRLAAFQRERD